MICDRAETPSLDDLARRVRRLIPSWGDPGKFYDQRDGIAHDLHRLARSGQCHDATTPAPNFRRPEPVPDERLRRLQALLAFKDDQIDQLRRQLVEACRPRPRRRRQPQDGQQLALPLTRTT